MANNRGDETIRKHFGEKVRLLRKKKGFSQEELALEAGMDLTSINEIEKGHRSPKLVTVYTIARALKITASDLLKP